MIEKICEFFGITQAQLTMVNEDIWFKMVEAVSDDNYMLLHQLGYELEK